MESKTTYPAKDPPTHGINEGTNAGAFPDVAAALAVFVGPGEGLFIIAKYGTSDRKLAYRSYGGGGGFRFGLNVLGACRR